MTPWIRWPDLMQSNGAHELGLDPIRYRVLQKNACFEMRVYPPCLMLGKVVPDLEEGGLRRASSLAVAMLDGVLPSPLPATAAPFPAALLAPVEPVQRRRYTRPLLHFSTPEGPIVALLLPRGLQDQISTPIPDGDFRLHRVPSQVVAAWMYSGPWSTRQDFLKVRQLRRALLKEGLEPLGSPIFARYHGPLWPPCMRRNEAWLTLAASVSDE